MIRTNQRPLLKAVLLGMSLLVAAALQGCQQRKPVASHDKVEFHDKVAHREAHSIRQKLREVIFGQEETLCWGHPILITPCRGAVKQTLSDNGPLDSHHVIKCGATKVEIINEELRVNEKSYGKLAAKAAVQVADGKVAINGSEVQPAAQVALK